MVVFKQFLSSFLVSHVVCELFALLSRAFTPGLTRLLHLCFGRLFPPFQLLFMSQVPIT